MLYSTNPNVPVFGLRREIDRLFEDTFGRNTGSSWTPAVDIRETQNEMRIDVELPGINPDAVEITADNGILTIRGEKSTERKEEEESRYHVIERSYGSFVRSFQLPPGLDDAGIDATFDSGILSIHIPKSALPQPKKIEIRSGSNAEVSAGNGGQTSSSSGQRRMNTGYESGGQPQSTNQMAASSTTRDTSSKGEQPRGDAPPTTGKTARGKSGSNS